MRITSRGQVTIPADIRERAGLQPRAEVAFEFDGKTARIVKIRTEKKAGRGGQLVRRLRGRATVAMSTDEIMRLTRSP